VRQASRQYVWTIRDIAVPLRTCAFYWALRRFKGFVELVPKSPLELSSPDTADSAKRRHLVLWRNGTGCYEGPVPPSASFETACSAGLQDARSHTDRTTVPGSRLVAGCPPGGSRLLSTFGFRTGAALLRRLLITSSARASSEGGTVSPSVLAVSTLITSSNLVGCCTGRSAGLTPLESRRAAKQNDELPPPHSTSLRSRRMQVLDLERQH